MSTYTTACPADVSRSAPVINHGVGGALTGLWRRIWATQLRSLALCVGLSALGLSAAGCTKEKREPLPVPAEEHSKPVPEKKVLGRLVETHPANISNALAGLTRHALTVRVKEAKLGPRFSWLRVVDDTGESWAITPPLAVTPTGDVTLTGWVRQRATSPLPGEATTVMVLWTAHIGGATVKPIELGEEAVIDPVFAAMELTGTVAQSKPPQFPQADHTIAGLHADKTNLEGKTIKIRGQVIHVIPDLSGRTWWLLRDGKSDDDPFAAGGINVLLVAANAPVDIGDVVLVEGSLQLDRAFTLTSAIPVMLMPAKQIKDDHSSAADDADPPGAATPADAPANQPADDRGEPADDRGEPADDRGEPADDRDEP